MEAKTLKEDMETTVRQTANEHKDFEKLKDSMETAKVYKCIFITSPPVLTSKYDSIHKTSTIGK